MAKPSAEEVTKLKERIAGLSPDEREAVVEALEPDIMKKVLALLNGFKPDDTKDDKKDDKKKPWWDILP